MIFKYILSASTVDLLLMYCAREIRPVYTHDR